MLAYFAQHIAGVNWLTKFITSRAGRKQHRELLFAQNADRLNSRYFWLLGVYAVTTTSIDCMTAYAAHFSSNFSRRPAHASLTTEHYWQLAEFALVTPEGAQHHCSRFAYLLSGVCRRALLRKTCVAAAFRRGIYAFSARLRQYFSIFRRRYFVAPYSVGHLRI